MSDNIKLTGKVAAILNSREVVINIGEEDGVEREMRFKILDREAVVKDPDTGEELGSIQREKVRVKVVEVRPKFSVARTYETVQVNIGGTGLYPARIIDAFNPPTWVTRVRTLSYSETGLDYEPLKEKDSFVKIGDQVELVEPGSASVWTED